MAKANNIVTFITDFDTKDGFVGSMKGVMLKINPDIRFVDISHHITPQKIWEGAFVLRNCFRYFPEGTTHLVVIDPGVGTDRKGIIVETQRYYFIAPDNGVLTLAYRKSEVIRTVEIQNDQYFQPIVSKTFHGRDIFSSVAAHLAGGVPIDEFGPEAEHGLMLQFPDIEVTGDRLYGSIIHVDTFGNLISNISPEILKQHGFDGDVCVEVGSRRIRNIKQTYFDVPVGDPVAIFGSTGFLEVAVNQGKANDILKLDVDDPICVRKRVCE